MHKDRQVTPLAVVDWPMNPLFGIRSGSFLGWWGDDLIWRDETGKAVGYLEPAYTKNELEELGEEQFYVVYGEDGRAVGETLHQFPEYGGDYVGRLPNTTIGPGKTRTLSPDELEHVDVPERPENRAGFRDSSWRDPGEVT